ncbi:MAG: diguanylate cyclase [Lachnospiraceae bacterium]|nr:diguanylate cyclase [Lachnospiraceae bacterium]
MKERILEIKRTLDRNIFVGKRLELNLRNMSITAVIIMAMGLVLTLVNVIQGQYLIALSPLLIFVAAVIAFVFVVRYKRREPAIVVSILSVTAVLTYDVLFADNGFAFLWTLLVPMTFCYMISVKIGFLVTIYFEILFFVLFYTPLRQLVAARYSEIVMSRFPLLFFFHGLLAMFVMYQYHKGVLFEIDHADRLEEEVARQTAVAEERSRRIEQMSFQTILTLANAIDAKDPYTKGHSTRVSQYSVLMAEALGWKAERVSDLKYAALLHDIGKIGVPDAILNNPRRLSDIEYDIIKSHATMGGDILKNRLTVEVAEDVARSHHERYDGTGYPSGKKGEEISEEARIVAIADSFDAMSSNRVYREACDPEYIHKELQRGKGTQFDPDLVEVFLTLWDQGQLDQILQNDAEDSADGERTEVAPSLLQEVMEAFAAQGNVDNIDITTGVLNRTAGEAAVAHQMKAESGSFVFFDVDNLKKINDINGHEAGDRALKLVGDILSAYSDDSLCCRLGGDEFLLFMMRASREAAEKRVRHIIDTFEEKKKLDPGIAAASLSAGIALCTPDEPYSSVYNRADKALYHVKQNGKNSYSFYDSDSEENETEQVDINLLVEGIRNSGSYQGAMDVEYRQFTRLYEFIMNLDKRFSHPFRLIMITLNPQSGEPFRQEELEKAMFCMEQSIRQTMRNVDIITRCSRQQFLVILLGVDPEGVRTAVDRIFRNYYKMNGSSAFSPSYDIAEMEGR